MKLTIELSGSEVVEVVARALYAHNISPSSDPMTVNWPPEHKHLLMGYWNKALAVVKAQHAYVAKREAEQLGMQTGTLPSDDSTAASSLKSGDTSG